MLEASRNCGESRRTQKPQKHQQALQECRSFTEHLRRIFHEKTSISHLHAHQPTAGCCGIHGAPLDFLEIFDGSHLYLQQHRPVVEHRSKIGMVMAQCFLANLDSLKIQTVCLIMFSLCIERGWVTRQGWSRLSSNCLLRRDIFPATTPGC